MSYSSGSSCIHNLWYHNIHQFGSGERCFGFLCATGLSTGERFLGFQLATGERFLGFQLATGERFLGFQLATGERFLGFQYATGKRFPLYYW